MITKILGIVFLIAAGVQFVITGIVFIIQAQVDPAVLDPSNPYAFGVWIALVLAGVAAMWQYTKQNNNHTQKQNDQLIKDMIDVLKQQSKDYSEAQKYVADKQLKSEQVRTEGIKRIADSINKLKKN